MTDQITRNHKGHHRVLPLPAPQPSIPTPSHTFCSTSYADPSVRLLHEGGALRGRGVPHGWEQEPAPGDPDGVVAGARGGVHRQLPGVPRVGARTEHARARRHGLQRRLRGALEEAAAVRVGHGAGQQRREVDHHAVHPDVRVRRHQRRRLRAVRRRLERPRALPGALVRRVPHPHVREPAAPARGGRSGGRGTGTVGCGRRGSGGRGGRRVEAAVGEAEPVDEDVGRRDHDGNGAAVRGEARGEGGQRGLREPAAEGERRVEHLAAEREPRCARVVPRRGGPPRRHGGRRRRGHGRREGEEEVGHDGALRRGEAPVPEQVHGVVSGEQLAVVVGERHGRLADEEQLPRRGRAGAGDRGEEDEEEGEAVVAELVGHGCQPERASEIS
ncbi:hypothetical protein SETIT_6G188900v2 [Setaria italica]|uniref:Uncharacterized protein n=1 Tax=Setaria italica TaxID=4555 RepID=A0A368RN96_SETIT|nr:hypothetical protein SETIT_6G188900v2 [Setaria italica]